MTVAAEWVTIALGIFIPLISLAGAGWMAKIQLDIRHVKTTLLTDIKLIKQAMITDRRESRRLRAKVIKNNDRLDEHKEMLIKHNIQLEGIVAKPVKPSPSEIKHG